MDYKSWIKLQPGQVLSADHKESPFTIVKVYEGQIDAYHAVGCNGQTHILSAYDYYNLVVEADKPILSRLQLIFNDPE